MLQIKITAPAIQYPYAMLVGLLFIKRKNTENMQYAKYSINVVAHSFFNFCVPI